jgi:hypothetical protein
LPEKYEVGTCIANSENTQFGVIVPNEEEAKENTYNYKVQSVLQLFSFWVNSYITP